jgi:hypothetical protein
MIDWAIAAFLFLGFLGAVEDVKRIRRRRALERQGIHTWNDHILLVDSSPQMDTTRSRSS